MRTGSCFFTDICSAQMDGAYVLITVLWRLHKYEAKVSKSLLTTIRAILPSDFRYDSEDLFDWVVK